MQLTLQKLRGKMRPGDVRELRLFRVVENGTLREMGTEQTRQVLRSALALHCLRVAERRVVAIFSDIFVICGHQLSCIMAGAYLQLTVTGKQKKRLVRIEKALEAPSFAISLYFYIIPCVKVLRAKMYRKMAVFLRLMKKGHPQHKLP